ncbi:hypothetical protein DID88_002006 [Monilinia fructigena]|uniref:J domain-containing protein n=1 Tax=Monilinia fructigena TaxID=38457 RepID=A0A395IWB0_9HELO|nr:hypothetical protein DID88_002006 [Monilinia fructigena]
MSATASGADAKSNGTAKSREHNQGNQDRKFTIEQKAAVIRVRRCSPTAFYDILGLEEVKTTVTETEIKKAYRKTEAFGVLSDKDKRAQYDRYGGDPDSRSGGGAPQSHPFSAFSQRSAGGAGEPGGRSMFEEEISAEEMFRRFFTTGGFGGGGLFDDQPGFVFNMGGGPGSLFSGGGSSGPTMRFDNPVPPHTAHRYAQIGTAGPAGRG